MARVKPRIKKVFEKVLENGGNVTQAMRDMKYSEATINNPKNVTETKSWEELLKEIPETKLIEVLNEGLNATMVKTSFTEPDKKLPDYAIRHKYLETGLKMKGKLIDRLGGENGEPIKIDIGDMLNKVYGDK